MESHSMSDVLERELPLSSVEIEPRTRPTIPEGELPKKALPRRAAFVAAALGTIVREEVAEVDRIRLAELASKARLADMD